jgi:hypothetical protein
MDPHPAPAEHPLVPGRHLRKNQRQVLAMAASATRKAGLEWTEHAEGSSGGTARVHSAPGGECLLEVRYAFGHTEIHFDFAARAGAAAGAGGRSTGIYTDTLPLMEGLRRWLAAVGGRAEGSAEP